ncbi:MAG: DNA methyltransferase [Dehalococcoidia bacterium]
MVMRQYRQSPRQNKLLEGVRPDDAAAKCDRDAERERYREKLRELLLSLRQIEGFPIGTDEDIVALSDPPYYTACPNPFLNEFIEKYGTPYDEATDDYHRLPLAVDASEGKTDPLYTAHGYHTKVPHKAIVRAILHYTDPGDVVLDGFAGSGMTGVAAQVCGDPDSELKQAVEAERATAGLAKPVWGARRAVLNDLSPAATFIASNYAIPFDVDAFEREARRILEEVRDELGWMYATKHRDGPATGTINYTVWSEVFTCPTCGAEIVFLTEALIQDTKRVRESFPCPKCLSILTKDTLQRYNETLLDPATGSPWQRVRFIPALINYQVGSARYEKTPDDVDLETIDKIASLPWPTSVPTNAFPIAKMYHGSRLAPKGFTHIHHMYLPRAAHALAALWRKASACPDLRIRHMLLFFVEQAIWGMSILNRYTPTHFSHVNQYLSGVYYVGSQIAEVSPWYILENKLDRLAKAFRQAKLCGGVTTTTGSCTSLPLPPRSVDYIFTDPPFGENIYYADLNYLVESWHRVFTDSQPEAIIDQAKKKVLADYQRLMQRCFEEYQRVLKPGRWMTVVFHNSRNSVWNAIQEAMLAAGFVVADVRTLDKQQGSYRQVTSTAVKQDLVISAYKPRSDFEAKFKQEAGTDHGAWDFVRQHLGRVPVFLQEREKLSIIAERQNYLLYDRMVAFHIQRGATVPLSAAEFYAGLRRDFPERDGMHFLPEQIPEYEEKRSKVGAAGQLALFVTDEQSTVQWLRAQLSEAKQTYQDLLPKFLQEIHQAPHEQLPELSSILDQNFIRDADGRWRLADPGKQDDLDAIREKALRKEFDGYAAGKGKLKQFRSEAVRAGFRSAWRDSNFTAIVGVGQRLPPTFLEDDPQLQMYYDNALDRVER